VYRGTGSELSAFDAHFLSVGEGLRNILPLKHRQFPGIASLVQAQDVEIAVVASELIVTIIPSWPSIDCFDDFDDAPVEPDALGLLDTGIVGVALDLDLHGRQAKSAISAGAGERNSLFCASHCAAASRVTRNCTFPPESTATGTPSQ
jgi:hypothetical protein